MTTWVPPPDVYARKAWKITGGGEITSLGNPAPAGTLLPIMFEDNATGRGMVSGSTLMLEGDFRYTAGSAILLWSTGTAWVELTRKSPATSKAFLSPYGPGTVGMHPGSGNPGVLSTQALLQDWTNNRVYAPVITIVLASDPSTVAATIEIDTSAVNGDVETFDVTASQDPGAEAADIVKQMTGQSPYTGASELTTARNVSTYFKVTSSGGTITLKPKMSYPGIRDITMRIVSGNGIESWTNLDGSAVSTSSVNVARAPMGGRVPMPAGLIDGQTNQDAALVLDVPGTVLVGQPGTVWELSENGGVIVEAEDCGVFATNMLWPEEGSGNRNGKAGILVAASAFTARGNKMTVDSIGAKSSGLSCSAMASIQVTAANPHHRSYSYRHHNILNNEFYLGNRVAPLTWNSVYDINAYNNLITSKFSRPNAFGDGSLVNTHAPLPARFTNCDEISWLNNRILNIGGHSAADNSEAPLVVERTSNGVDGTHEGGHITIQGGTVHGTVNNYAAQIVLRNLWFARVFDVEMHRHLIPTPAETVNGGATTLTLSGGAPWTAGSTLTMTASASQFNSATEVGNTYLLSNSGTVQVRVTGYTSPTVVTVLALGNVPAGLQSTATAVWTRYIPYASPDYEDCAGLLVEDCAQVLVRGLEGFNFGTDGGDYARYPFIGVKSMENTQAALGAFGPKTIAVSECSYLADVEATSNGTENSHPFFVYYNTKFRDAYDLVSVTNNTLMAGGYGLARFTIDDNSAFNTGDGFEIVVPNSITGSGDLTITVNEGTYFSKSASSADLTAQAIVTAMNADSNVTTYFRVYLTETEYHDSTPNAGATVWIETKVHGADRNDITFEHLTTVAGRSTLLVGPGSGTEIAEAATDNLAGGFGATLLDGQTAIALTDPWGSSNVPHLHNTGPKQARVAGNNIRGFAIGGEILETLAPSGDVGTETNNVFADDNTIS